MKMNIFKILKNKKGSGELIAMALLILYVVLVLIQPLNTTQQLIKSAMGKMDSNMKNQMSNNTYNSIAPSVSITCPATVTGRSVDISVSSSVSYLTLSDITVTADNGATVTKIDNTNFKINFSSTSDYTITATVTASNGKTSVDTKTISVTYM